MNKQKSKADEIIERLNKALEKAGFEPIKPVEKTGCFVTIINKRKGE